MHQFFTIYIYILSSIVLWLLQVYALLLAVLAEALRPVPTQASVADFFTPFVSLVGSMSTLSLSTANSASPAETRDLVINQCIAVWQEMRNHFDSTYQLYPSLWLRLDLSLTTQHSIGAPQPVASMLLLAVSKRDKAEVLYVFVCSDKFMLRLSDFITIHTFSLPAQLSSFSDIICGATGLWPTAVDDSYSASLGYPSGKILWLGYVWLSTRVTGVWLTSTRGPHVVTHVT